jgi:putative membrane protein
MEGVIGMENQLEMLLKNPYFSMVAYFSVAVLALIFFLYCFELLTKYRCWDEIKQGNLAVAMATGGKIFGICNIFRSSIQEARNIYESLTWATFGFVLLIIAYFLFEFLTPVFHIDEEIGKDNRAVGFIAMMISISLSFIIGAGLS